MKHIDMAAVVAAALLVATCSAQMTANALVPSVDLASGDARAHIDAALHRNAPMTVAERPF